MIEVKPCPFCGCEEVYLFVDRFYTNHVMYFCTCGNSDCGCRAPSFEDEEEALKVWNERTYRVLWKRRQTIRKSVLVPADWNETTEGGRE